MFGRVNINGSLVLVEEALMELITPNRFVFVNDMYEPLDLHIGLCFEQTKELVTIDNLDDIRRYDVIDREDNTILFANSVKEYSFKSKALYFSKELLKTYIEYFSKEHNPFSDLLTRNPLDEEDQALYYNHTIFDIDDSADIIRQFVNSNGKEQVVAVVDKWLANIVRKRFLRIIESQPETVLKVTCSNNFIDVFSLGDIRSLRYSNMLETLNYNNTIKDADYISEELYKLENS